MGPETPEILRENSEQHLVPGSPLHSLSAAAGMERTELPEHRRCPAEVPESSHQVPASPSSPVGPVGPAARSLAGIPRPRLGPCPEQPLPPTRGHGPVPTRRPRQEDERPPGRHIVPGCGAPDTAVRPLPDTQRATSRPRCPCPAPRRRAGPSGAPGGRSPWWGLRGPLPSRLGRTLRAAAAAALPPAAAAAAPGSSRALPPPSPAHAQCGEPEPSRGAAAVAAGGLARRWGRSGHQGNLGPSREGKIPPQPPGGFYGVGSEETRRGQVGERGPSGSSPWEPLFRREKSLCVPVSSISKGHTLSERPVWAPGPCGRPSRGPEHGKGEVGKSPGLSRMDWQKRQNRLLSSHGDR